ncbi:MAG: FHA domain-containing protein [Bdellovibrionales bacterium]|nr:FHA domain-containing protein [Bdellovibrionales bacterium]
MKLSVFKNNNVLEVISLDDKISESGSTVFFIGRGIECYIRLDDRMVSREHAKLIFDNKIWTLKNISSLKNSIKINGIYQEEKKLEESDFISIGPFDINISELTDTLTQEQPVSLSTDQEPEKLEETEPSVEEEEVSSEEGAVSLEQENDEEVKEEGELEENDEWDEQPLDSESENIEEGDQNNEEETSGVDFSEEQEDEEDPFGGGEFDSGDDGGFDDGGFQESPDGGDSFGVQTTGGSEDTQEIKLAEYYLHLEGEVVPFNKMLLDNGDILVGRNPEKCQIYLNDPEVSGEHLKITKTKVSCVIEDLNSSNGTIMNGEKVKKAELLDGDSFQVGSTLFTLKITSDFLESQKNMLMPVEENQEIEVEEIVEVATTFGDEEEGETEGDQLGSPGEKKSLLEQIKNDPVKRKRAIMIGGVLVLLLLFMDTDPPKDKKPKVAKKDEKIEDKKITKDDKKKEKPKFKPEEQEFLEASYLLSKELFQTGKYRETLIELQKIFNITKDYKNAKQIYSLAKQGLAKLEELERKRKEEIERKKRERRVQEMVKKAREATDKKSFSLAKSLFTEIIKLDPENYDVPQMKLEIDAFEAEQKRKEEEERLKIETRNKMVSQLAPSKKFFMSKDWYRSIIKLQQFLQISPMDDDLVKEATTMLEESKKSLNDQIIPLLAKARSLGEGEDLKGAYEIYSKVLFHDPSNGEAVEEMGRIKELLHFRAMKIYRHAIISESLSLFDDAKEKFQEVQQISPTDSEYYKKATEKLSEYIE